MWLRKQRLWGCPLTCPGEDEACPLGTEMQGERVQVQEDSGSMMALKARSLRNGRLPCLHGSPSTPAGGAQQMTGEASADLWAEDGSNDLFTSQFTWHTVVWGLSQGHRVRKWQS
jgi:hypothetical protein